MILHVARREWLEQRRHPLMLWVCAVLLLLIVSIVLSLLGLLQLIDNDPTAQASLESLVPGPASVTVAAGTQLALSSFGFLIFSQYLGFVGVIAGHSLLNDHQVGTLPFLLLAPVRRGQLLAGKVLGALGPVTLIFWLLGVAAGILVAALPVVVLHVELSPRTLSWWIALFGAGPAWAGFVATVCVVISALARDVRLAQQGVWFVVFFVHLVVAFLITGALGSTSAELTAAGLGALCAALAWALGAQVLSRDLRR